MKRSPWCSTKKHNPPGSIGSAKAIIDLNWARSGTDTLRASSRTPSSRPNSAEVTAVAGRKIYSTGAGRLDGPEGAVADRADALFIKVKVDHFIDNGRTEEIQAAMSDPDQQRRARAFEVNP